MIPQNPYIFNRSNQKRPLKSLDFSTLDYCFHDLEPNADNWYKRKHLSEILCNVLSKAPATLENANLPKIANRLSECSKWLRYTPSNDGYRLEKSFFCHSRFCPICQHQHIAERQKNLDDLYKELRQQFPRCKFILATFTVKNQEIAHIQPLLEQMGKAMTKLLNRKSVKQPLIGYMKTFEMVRPTIKVGDRKVVCPTYGNTHAHPHYHILFVLKSTGKNYLTQATLQHLWQECLGVDYLPHVHTRNIFSRAEIKRLGDLQAENYKLNTFVKVAKYLVKTANILGDWDSNTSNEWTHHYCRLMHGKRTLSAGGAVRDILHELKERELIQKQLAKEKKEREKLANITDGTPPPAILMKFAPSYFLAPFAPDWEQKITCNYFYDQEKTAYVNEQCTPPIPIPQAHLDIMTEPKPKLNLITVRTSRHIFHLSGRGISGVYDDLIDDKKAQPSEPLEIADDADYLIQVGFLPPSWKSCTYAKGMSSSPT